MQVAIETLFADMKKDIMDKKFKLKYKNILTVRILLKLPVFGSTHNIHK